MPILHIKLKFSINQHEKFKFCTKGKIIAACYSVSWCTYIGSGNRTTINIMDTVFSFSSNSARECRYYM